MALKALLGLVFVIGVAMGGGHLPKPGAEGEEHHDEEKGMMKGMENKNYNKMMKKDYEKMDEEDDDYMKKGMDGMMKQPMMCYHKKGKMGMKDKKGMKYGKKMGKGLNEMLNQAARLLGVVMMETGGGDDMNKEALDEMKKMLKQMMKDNKGEEMLKKEKPKKEEESEEEKTEDQLGEELFNIVTDLLNTGESIPGVTVSLTKTQDSVAYISPPMNDEPMMPEAPAVVEGGFGGLLGNFDLKSLGLDVKGLIEMIKNPSMSFLVDSMGLGPLIKLLDDPTISVIVESLDMDTLISLIQSGKLNSLQQGATAESMLALLQSIEMPEDGDKEREVTSKDMKEGTDKKTDEKKDMKKEDDKKNKIEEMKTDDKKDMNKLKPMKKPRRKPMKKQTLTEMRVNDQKVLEAFDKIIKLAGVEGDVDESNIVESVLQAMRFIINADEDTLAQMIEAIGDLDIDILDTLLGDLLEEDEMKEMDGMKKMRGMKDKDSKEMMDKDGIEMICYPMGMEDMKKYAMEMGGEYEMMQMIGGKVEMGEKYEKRTMMTGKGDMGDKKMYKQEMGEKGEKGDKKNMGYKRGMGDKKMGMKKKDMDDEDMEDMKEGTCSMSCNNMEKMMKETMQNMIQIELGKTAMDMMTAFNSVSEIDPMVKAMLERVVMINGVKEPEEKSMETTDYKEDEKDDDDDEDDDKFEDWLAWGECSMPCNGGITIRTRVCKEKYLSSGTPDCEESQSRACNEQPCGGSIPIPTPEKAAEKTKKPEPMTMPEKPAEVNLKPETTPSPEMIPDTTTMMVEKWAEYSNWDPCTKSCGGGISIRSRMCTAQYMSMYPGGDCEESESRICNEQMCPPAERIWGEWTEWTSCTVQCNGGTTYRARTCLDEKKEDCTEVQSEMCNAQPCTVTVEPVRDEWYEWEAWGPCSVSCGVGSVTRARKCVKKSASSSCEQVQSRSCFEGVCPVPTAVLPFYQEWTEWTPCSVTCGSGISIRRRLCNDPMKPNCEDIASQPCQLRPCAPAPGIWGLWSEWTRCSQTCGFGLRTRKRNCLSGGCNGQNEMTETCTMQPTCTTMPPMVTVKRCPASPYRQLRLDEGCIVFHGRDSGKKSFDEYRSYCMARGGDIVQMQGLDKWIQVTYWLRTVMRNGFTAQNSMPWIGSEYDGTMWSHPAQTSKKSFTIWGQNQSKAPNFNRCATLNGDNGHGFKMMCNSPHYAVCEYKTS